jgi:DoxX-like protein
LLANGFASMGFPIPEALAYGLGVLQLLGGAALAVGLWTQPVALLFALEPWSRDGAGLKTGAYRVPFFKAYMSDFDK